MNHPSSDTHHQALQDLALKRHESRYTGQSVPLATLPANIQEQIYPEPVTTTVYIGIPDAEGTEKDISGKGFIRFRFRSPIAIAPSQRVWLPNMEQRGNLELKLRFKEVGTHEPTEKVVIEDITLGDALALLRSDDTSEAYEDNIEMFLAKTNNLFTSHGLSPKDVTLLAFSQAARRHFVWKSITDDKKVARITLDTGMSLWLCGHAKKQRLVFAKKVRTLPEKKLEIKASGTEILDSADEQVILHELFGRYDYMTDSRIKRRHFFDILEEKGRPRLVSGENANLSAASYVFQEKEIKIDCGADPRGFLRVNHELGAEGMALGPAFPYEMYFKYLRFNTGEVIRVKSDDADFSRPTFQYKMQQKAEDSSTILVRKKVSRTSLEDFDFHLDLSSYVETPAAKRDELLRAVVCTDTENLFIIIADHCATPGRQPLNQIEVEFLGKLGYPEDYSSGFDSKTIDEEMKKIAALIISRLKEQNIAVLDSRTTKETWLTQEK